MNYISVRLKGGGGIDQLMHDLRKKLCEYARRLSEDNFLFFNQAESAFKQTEQKQVALLYSKLYEQYYDDRNQHKMVYKAKIQQSLQSKANTWLKGIITFSSCMYDDYKKQPQLFKNKLKQSIKALEKHFKIKIIYHVLHADEKTPHIHFQALNFDKNGKSIQRTIKKDILSNAQDVVGEIWQDFASGYRRGEEKIHTNATHLSVVEMHQAEIKELQEKNTQLEQELSSIKNALKTAELTVKKLTQSIDEIDNFQTHVLENLVTITDIKTFKKALSKDDPLYTLKNRIYNTATRLINNQADAVKAEKSVTYFKNNIEKLKAEYTKQQENLNTATEFNHNLSKELKANEEKNTQLVATNKQLWEENSKVEHNNEKLVEKNDELLSKNYKFKKENQNLNCLNADMQYTKEHYRKAQQKVKEKEVEVKTGVIKSELQVFPDLSVNDAQLLFANVYSQEQKIKHLNEQKRQAEKRLKDSTDKEQQMKTQLKTLRNKFNEVEYLKKLAQSLLEKLGTKISIKDLEKKVYEHYLQKQDSLFINSLLNKTSSSNESCSIIKISEKGVSQVALSDNFIMQLQHQKLFEVNQKNGYVVYHNNTDNSYYLNFDKARSIAAYDKAIKLSEENNWDYSEKAIYGSSDFKSAISKRLSANNESWREQLLKQTIRSQRAFYVIYRNEIKQEIIKDFDVFDSGKVTKAVYKDKKAAVYDCKDKNKIIIDCEPGSENDAIKLGLEMAKAKDWNLRRLKVSGSGEFKEKVKTQINQLLAERKNKSETLTIPSKKRVAENAALSPRV